MFISYNFLKNGAYAMSFVFNKQVRGPEKDFESLSDKEMAMAVSKGNLTQIEKMLNEKIVSKSARGKNGANWLSIAIAYRQKNAFELLLKLGVLNDPKGENAGTALYMATMLDDLYWLKLLVGAGADLNNFGGGDLLLVRAMDTRNKETLKFYLENGADIHRTTLGGGNIALAAAEVHRFDMANEFLDLGVSPWVIDKMGGTLGWHAEFAAKVPAWNPLSAMEKHRNSLLIRLKKLGYPQPAPIPKEAKLIRSKGLWPPVK